MKQIGFIGLGNMGLPMAINLKQAGFGVCAFDIAPSAAKAASDAGLDFATDINQALSKLDIVITMLPAGAHVQDFFENHIAAHCKSGTIFIDCSTIDVATTRTLAAKAADKGITMLDAPVSGGVAAAAAGALTFMVGGKPADFEAAKVILQPMAKAIIHCGDHGAGGAAKLCNNLMLGIQMISVCEAFALAQALGLEADKLYEVSSKASGQCWSLTSYCPEAGLVESAPSNHNYKPGFSAAMMLKDLRLAAAAKAAYGKQAGLGLAAMQLYQEFVDNGNEGVDFSGIIRPFKAS